MIGGSYVLAALVFVLAVAGAGITGWHERGKQADAEISAIRSGLEAKVAQAQKLAAETSERVVIRYQDRVKVIREVPQEVVHEIEVIRQSKCVLPAEFRVLYARAAAGRDLTDTERADAESGEVDCDAAAQAINDNFGRANKAIAKLDALQEYLSQTAEIDPNAP